ncbi:MAG: 3'-5' exonuclease [Bacteroidota bacterium]
MEGLEWFRKLRNSVRGKPKLVIDPNWPEWYQSYFSTFDQFSAKGHPVEALNIIVIDAETTGLDVAKDRLLSLGGLRVQGNTIHLQEQFEAYCPTPLDHYNAEAVAIHGIIPNSERYTYSNEADMLAQFLGFLEDQVIVGHHIGFDVEMINRALGRLGAGKLKNRVIDTAVLAERLQPTGYWTTPDQFSLDKLVRRYKIPLSDRHTALGDAFITAVLWLKLVSRLQERAKKALVVEDL